MYVGIGSMPSRFLDRVREYVSSEKVFIYPEFFDSKNELLSGVSVASYVMRILENRDRIVFAVFPDYHSRDRWGLCNLDVLWIYPLHRRQELQCLPPCIEFIGIPCDRESRNYDIWEIYDVVKQLGYRLWLLGLRPSAVKLLRYYRFDGVDITTLSIPKWQFSDNRNPRAAEMFAFFAESLAEGRLLDKYSLYKQFENGVRRNGAVL